ncbi:1564_t:CDS:10 [Paraglomus brasilianum]|uniref:Histone acetyltransferase type B catalytic subunit n=1 Tax=Paraglomus brasilianum TaxID=144538 RepID=A0A9N8ZLE2_9GLOM|nr:1564_t:CDS:10 [Paraglomus brasilianum]
MTITTVNQEEWVCNANDVLKLRLVCAHTSDPYEHPEGEYHQLLPQFTYSLFGPLQQIYGYKNLKIKLYYAAGSLVTYLDVSYDEKISDHLPGAKPTDVIGIIREYIPEGFMTNYDTFLQRVQKDTHAFVPMGEKISEYRLSDDDSTVYEIYKANFNTPGFKEYHSRLQLFVLLYIDGARYINEDDEKWEIALVFQKKSTGDSNIYNIIGYCTMYAFFFYEKCEGSKPLSEIKDISNELNETSNFSYSTRLRISQFLILPPYQKQDHGSRLYQALYRNLLANPWIKELTVEDPNDAFSDLRDKNDLMYLVENKIVEGLPIPLDKSKVEEVRRKCKLDQRQMHRCIEMLMLKRLNKSDVNAYKAYRIQVKKRLYNHNKDVLCQMSKSERIEKLAETYISIEEDYYRILSL